MAIVIRDADIKHDRKVIMDCLLRNRRRYEDNETFERRFTWGYCDNPHGSGRAWLALDTSTDKVIGFTSAFPRRAVVNGEMLVGWNCADFSIDKKYRTLGAAIKLRRASKECVDSGEFSFLYAHPNSRLQVVYEKSGYDQIGKMIRYAYLLRFEKKFISLLGKNFATQFLYTVANPFLRIITPNIPRSEKYQFSIVEEKNFGEEYEKLFEMVMQYHKIIVYRDSEYMNWRFLRNPLFHMKCFRMHADGELKGYILYNEDADVAYVRDLLVEGKSEEMRILIGAFIFWLRKAGTCTISLRLHDMNPFLVQAQQLGFRYRDDSTSTAFIYTSHTAPYASTLRDGRNWYMTGGDSDI